MIWFSGSKYCFLYFRREVYCINFETIEKNCCKSNTKYATITWIANEEKRGWNDGEFNWGWKLYDYRPVFFMHLSGWNFRKDIYFSYRSPYFHNCFSRECCDHLFSTGGVFPSSAVKTFFGCLAFTDLGVGFIVHPLRFGRYLSLDHSKTCHYLSIFYLVTGFVFAGLSLLTITAISVDRLFALSLGLGYGEVVTVKRVRALVAWFWVSIGLLATVVFQSVRIALGIAFVVLLSCIIISTFCYIKIYHALRLRLSPAKGKVTKVNQMEKEFSKAKHGTTRQCPQQCGFKWPYTGLLSSVWSSRSF